MAGLGAAHDAFSNVPSGLFPYSPPVFSDFDGDNKLDRAALSSEGPLKTIHIAFGKSSWSSLSFDSGVSDPGRLVAGDVDGDGDADLIWVSQSDSRKFAAWLGDDRGNFSIGTDSELDFPRMEALLGDAGSGLTSHSIGCEPLGVLPNTIFIALPTFPDSPYTLLSEISLLTAQPPAVCLLFLSVLKKRGPPSKLF